MRKYFVSILFLAVSFNVKAQPQSANNPLTDSLKQNLTKATTHKEKVKWLGQLSLFYMGVDKALSDDYAKQHSG